MNPKDIKKEFEESKKRIKAAKKKFRDAVNKAYKNAENKKEV